MSITQSVEDLITKKKQRKEEGIHSFLLPVCLLELGHLISSSLPLGLGFKTLAPLVP